MLGFQVLHVFALSLFAWCILCKCEVALVGIPSDSAFLFTTPSFFVHVFMHTYVPTYPFQAPSGGEVSHELRLRNRKKQRETTRGVNLPITNVTPYPPKKK